MCALPLLIGVIVITILQTFKRVKCHSSSSLVFAETEHSCKVCCRGQDGTCSPFVQDNGSFLFLRKGKPCTVGFCDEGVSRQIFSMYSLYRPFFQSVVLKDT